MAYEFHYTPTGTGAISGKEVLEQTEDAINDLGNTAISGVQEALDKAEQALTNSANAVDDAQTALNTANNAEGVAIQAQNDVSNLSETVTNLGNRETTAEGNISNLQGRMTTAEGNITNLQGRMTTAEGNIGNLQTAVSTAQATANSAQQTATTARLQSYVFRYSSIALTASSTNSNALLDNTDNLKVGDKVIDSSGVIYSVTAIDTANSTFTIGTSLIDLAQDSDVVHKSGDETVSGTKTFNDLQIIGYGTQYKGARNAYILPEFSAGYSGLSITTLGYGQTLKIGNFVLDANNKPSLDTSKGYIQVATGENNSVNTCVLEPRNTTSSFLGTSSNKWGGIYATNYYYGANNTEFSQKFVTTDTAQTISGNKTFSEDIIISNSDTSQISKRLVIRSSKVNLGDSNSDSWGISFNAGASYVALINSEKSPNFMQGLSFSVRTKDTDNNLISASYRLRIYTDGSANLMPNETDSISLGSSSNKWKDVQTNKINGLEPSSLSLPSQAYVDISSYFTNTGDSETNSYVASANGWIYLRLGDISGCQATVYDSNNNRMWGQSTTGKVEQITIPILKDQTLTTQWNTSSTVTVAIARFYPCHGNV